MLEETIAAIKITTDDFAKTLPSDGDWEPMLFLFKDNKATAMVFPMPPNGAMRDFFFESVLPNQIKPHEPDAVVILVSTWMAPEMSEEDYEKTVRGEAPMPSERPDRKEAIVIQGVSKEEEKTAVGEIIRSDGPPELDWEVLPDDVESYGGRMISALRRGVWE